MKKLKRAIATFILDGKDCWQKLDGQNIAILNMAYKYDFPINPYITENMIRMHIKKLMPCFFKE